MEFPEMSMYWIVIYLMSKILVELFEILRLPFKEGVVVNSFVDLLIVFMIFKSERLRVKSSPLISWFIPSICLEINKYLLFSNDRLLLKCTDWKSIIKRIN